MTREEIIEALRVAHKELGMNVSEYVEYANDKYNLISDAEKVSSDSALAFRSGAVKTQLEAILSAMEGR